MRRAALLLLAALLGLLLPTAAWGAGASGSASASGEGAAISYVEPTDDGRVQLVVSLPPSADPDLDSVRVSVGGADVVATAEPAGTSGAVQRTAVLVMDTSNSMEGERFAAAQSAALAYVDGLPDDVSLGIVTFAKEVAQPLAPTTDRDAARAVIADLELSGQTALYDGVLSAVDVAGTQGQRTLVVLSDGADTTETTLESVTAAVSAAEVTLDVVSLEQSPDGDLTTLAEAGGGEVIPATSAALTGTFAAEADALTRQVLVTAEVPTDLQSVEQQVAVTLATSGGDLTAEAFATVAQSIAGGTGVVVVAGVLGLLLGAGNILLGLLFLGLGVVGPWVYLGIRRSRRRKAFNAGLPDTLQLISGSLSAGLSLAQSVDTVVREGPEPISTEFRRVLVETRLGVTIEDALEGLAERFDSKDFEWVVMAIRIQRQVGGNLAELLDTVAGTMREREYVRRQVAALSAEGRLSAWVLGLLPPLFMVYLLLTNYDYVSILFTDPRGLVILAGATLWLAVGVFWMSRLVKVEV